MKFECRGEVFIKPSNKYLELEASSSLKTILQDIHLELDNHLLTLRATNLELFCEKSIPVKGLLTEHVFYKARHSYESFQPFNHLILYLPVKS
jgi:DNA polymerase III sliding clamp (beta) subunit (PCNA family)